MRYIRKVTLLLTVSLFTVFLMFSGCSDDSSNNATLADTIPVGSGESLSNYPDPTRFESSILAFEAADDESFPPSDAIVAAGSSSILIWQLTTIHEDLDPLTIIARGFGGSNMNDLAYYTDRIIMPYSPRALVIYEGENDIAIDVTPADIILKFRDTIDYLHENLPELRIYLLSAKLSPSREDYKDNLLTLNHYMKLLCEEDVRLTFIDVTSPMLDDEGNPDPSLFLDDMLHMNPSGYVLWKDAVYPVLSAVELPYESP